MKRFMNARKIALGAIGGFGSSIKQKREAALLESYGLSTVLDDSACVFCTGQLERLDFSGTSRTMQCSECGRCELVIESHDAYCAIPLEEFHIIRGEGVGKRPLAETSLAQHLVEYLVRGRWPRPAAIVDFGIESESHFNAMIEAVWYGCSVYELDRVLGEGNAITHLIRAYEVVGPTFSTVYDLQREDELNWPFTRD